MRLTPTASMEGEREGQAQGEAQAEAQGEAQGEAQAEAQAEAQGEASTDTQPAAAQLSESTSESKIRIDENGSDKTGTETEETPPLEEGAGLSASKTPDTSRPHSSSSSARAKSSTSGEIIFEAKKKKKRGGSAAPDDAYTVTFTVSISMAIPTGEGVRSFVPCVNTELDTAYQCGLVCD